MKRSSESITLTLIGAALSLPGCSGPQPPPSAPCPQPAPVQSEWGGGEADRQDDKEPGQACYNQQYHGSGRATLSHSSFLPLYFGARAAGLGSSSSYRGPAPAPVPIRPGGAPYKAPTTSSAPVRGGGTSSFGGTTRGGFGSTGRSAGAASS